MTTPLTPVPVRLGATLPIPSDTELCDSASLAGPFQPCINGLEWASQICDAFVHGGFLAASTNNVQLQTVTGRVYNINGLTIPAQVDTQEISYAGSMQHRKRVMKPTASSAGTYAIPYYTEIAYVPESLTVVSGVIWQLANPPAGDANHMWLVKCVNQGNPASAGVGITIKDATATTIGFIYGIATTASLPKRMSMTFGWNGAAWETVDQSYITW